MSYILDALKKLETEKTRRARSAGVVTIAGELFREERPRPAPTGAWRAVAGVAVAVLLTFSLTWFFLKGTTGRGVREKRPAIPLVQPVPSPLPTALTPSAVQPPPIIAAAPPQPAAPASPRIPAPVAAPPAAGRANLPAEDGEEPVQSGRAASVPASATPSRAQVVAAPADIKLSGIAWQDERKARRAVVNGFLMREGSVVAGARITDILQDRVRFSQSGAVFELPLISAALPGSGK